MKTSLLARTRRHFYVDIAAPLLARHQYPATAWLSSRASQSRDGSLSRATAGPHCVHSALQGAFPPSQWLNDVFDVTLPCFVRHARLCLALFRLPTLKQTFRSSTITLRGFVHGTAAHPRPLRLAKRIVGAAALAGRWSGRCHARHCTQMWTKHFVGFVFLGILSLEAVADDGSPKDPHDDKNQNAGRLMTAVPPRARGLRLICFCCQR